MKQLKLVVLVSVLVLGAVSCQNDETEIQMSNDQIDQEVVAENLMVELDELTDEGIDIQLGKLKSGNSNRVFLNDDCPVIIYDKISTPRKITLDFGTGCVGRDDKVGQNYYHLHCFRKSVSNT